MFRSLLLSVLEILSLKNIFNKINNCHNTEDFKKLAKSKLPAPIFHYIDGGADDEITLRRNTEAYEQ